MWLDLKYFNFMWDFTRFLHSTIEYGLLPSQKNLHKLPQLKFQCDIKDDVTLIIKLHDLLIYTQAGLTKRKKKIINRYKFTVKRDSLKDWESICVSYINWMIRKCFPSWIILFCFNEKLSWNWESKGRNICVDFVRLFCS